MNKQDISILQIFDKITNRKYITQTDILRELDLTIEQYIDNKVILSINRLIKSDKINSALMGQTTVYLKS